MYDDLCSVRFLTTNQLKYLNNVFNAEWIMESVSFDGNVSVMQKER